MQILKDLRDLTPNQRNAVLASFLGWTLDAFDFFIIVFVLKDIAKEFKADIPSVTATLFLTLAMRPLGALLFGIVADRFGRRPTLMIDILFYSIVEFLSGFAPSLTALIILRGLYGIAMGGEWGVGASLTMETIPAKTRGIVSGLLQAGYPSGYLLAAVLYGTSYHFLGWRGMFMVGALPAFLVLFIRRNVEESPAWKLRRGRPVPIGGGIGATIKGRWKLFIYVIVLMTAFNSFSHGTQDIYPTFLLKGRGFSAGVVGLLGVIYNVGSLAGGFVFGTLSERWGRKRAIITAALLAIPIVPLFAYAHSPLVLGVGAFLMQFMVQGAWGVVPAYLTELSPGPVRAIFPGLAYQLGNLLTSRNLVIQNKLVEGLHNNYAPVLAGTVVVVAITLAVVTACGRESRGVELEAV